MVTADWGLDLDETLHEDRWESLDSDDPAMVGGAKAAIAEGYEPADEAPLWCFVPAIWPGHARMWVRDTRVRHSSVGGERGPSRRVPWCTADYAEVESEQSRLLHDCGFPPRPAGRLWLLKPPPGFDSLDEALRHIMAAWVASGGHVMATAAFATYVQREVHRLFFEAGAGRAVDG